MSLQGTNKPSAIQESLGTQQTQQQPQASGQPQNTPLRSRSLADVAFQNSLPMQWTTNAAALEQVRKDLESVIPEDHRDFVTRLIPIDHASAGLPVSILIVAVQNRHNLGMGVGYHCLLIEASAGKLRSRTATIFNEQVEIDYYVSSLYDDRTIDIVMNVMRREFPNTRIVQGDASVVYANTPTKEKNPDAIGRIAKNSTAAAATALGRLNSSYNQLNLAEDNHKTINTIHVTHKSPTLLDNAYQPVRADMLIELAVRPDDVRHNQTPYDAGLASRTISQVGGYFDLLWEPSQMAQMMRQAFGIPQNASFDPSVYQVYTQQFVITSIDAMDQSSTVQMLALATANAAGQNLENIRFFEKNPQAGKNDIRDPGALAIESLLGNPGSIQQAPNGQRWAPKLPTDIASFGPSDLAVLVRSTIAEGISIAIDVPECGAQSWQLMTFMGAARGDNGSRQELIRAANILTNGNFDKYFENNDPIFLGRPVRVHAGYYTDEQGNLADIRDLDYLALLNLIQPENGELDMLSKWTNSFVYYNDQPELQLSKRKEIIKANFSSVVFTGFYQRLTFNPKFMTAIVKALHDVKLSLVPASSVNSNHMSQRGVANMRAAVMTPSQQAGFYSSTIPYNPNPQQPIYQGSVSAQRWGGGV